ncbi:hypothetical protein XELAEV_18012332mg [Xenopus laevis]|uniref:Uncharacterized protein n=1 Tax=Xenopus laevis TaxID=8355 RepID=A0A974DMC1_XENLA|nr:hypothetical protein XELAEV_18012332mg [Xenopus laevis]
MDCGPASKKAGEEVKESCEEIAEVFSDALSISEEECRPKPSHGVLIAPAVGKFGFIEAERKRILNSAHNLPIQALPAIPDIFQQLEQLRRRETAWALHSFIYGVAKVHRIPRGLRIRLNLIIFKEDKEFLQKWQDILNKCSLDLITLTIQQLQTGLKDISQQIHVMEDDYKSKITKENDTTLRELDERKEKLEQEILQTKLRKFRLDTNDYERGEVYNWRDARKGQRRKNASRFPYTTPGSQSSASENTSAISSQDSFISSPAFLGAGPQSTRAKRKDQENQLETLKIGNYRGQRKRSPAELSVLNKGLNFVPICTNTPFEFYERFFQVCKVAQT